MGGRHGRWDVERDAASTADEPARRRSDEGRPQDRRVLELQRLAGNAATTGLLALQRDDGKGAPNDAAKGAPSDGAEAAWEGHLKTSLGEKGNLYHTLNNFGDQQLSYQLEVTNTGYAMVTLGTQFEFQRRGAAGGEDSISIEDVGRRAGRRRRISELGGSSTKLEREWFAFGVTRGKTEQSTYGLPPHSSLHLRLFGERDYTDPQQSHVEGTLRVRRLK
jgi:hypothetical protein